MLKVLKDLGERNGRGRSGALALPTDDLERSRRGTLLPSGSLDRDDEDGRGGDDSEGCATETADVTPLSRRIPMLVVPHYSPFKAIWDWIILLLVLYTAIVTPYVAAFLHMQDAAITHINISITTARSSSISGSISSSSNNSNNTLAQSSSEFANPLWTVDLIVDIMFMADILINFRTTYIHDGEIVTEPKKIALNYATGWFIIDGIAAIPFDMLFSGSGTPETVKVMGVLKTARLLRMLRVARRIDQYSEYGAAAVLLLLMGTFALTGHWLACVFYAIGVIERPRLDQPISWLDHLANYTHRYYVNDTGPDLRSCYITALYYTFTTISSIGFGNVAAQTNAEKIFAIFAMLIGSLMNAAIFGNVSNIMLRLYRGTEEYHELQQSIKEFIKFHRIPKSLAARLIETHQHSYAETNGIDMISVLRTFPEVIQADICLHINRNLLNGCEAFRAASPGCLRALSMKFKTTHSPPGDTFIHPGDIIDSIYFITRGSIQIAKEDTIIAVLGKDDIIGEHVNAYLPRLKTSMTKSAYRIGALTYCDLNKILLSDLHEILEVYPEFAADFQRKFRVTFNLKEDESVAVTRPHPPAVHLESTDATESVDYSLATTSDAAQFPWQHDDVASADSHTRQDKSVSPPPDPNKPRNVLAEALHVRERKLSYKRKGGRDQKSRLLRQALLLQASAEDVAKRQRDARAISEGRPTVLVTEAVSSPTSHLAPNQTQCFTQTVSQSQLARSVSLPLASHRTLRVQSSVPCSSSTRDAPHLPSNLEAPRHDSNTNNVIDSPYTVAPSSEGDVTYTVLVDIVRAPHESDQSQSYLPGDASEVVRADDERITGEETPVTPTGPTDNAACTDTNFTVTDAPTDVLDQYKITSLADVYVHLDIIGRKVRNFEHSLSGTLNTVLLLLGESPLSSTPARTPLLLQSSH